MARPPIHGQALTGRRTGTFISWSQMRQRCTNPGHHAYARYGGRGIACCERWAEFLAFYADMGDRPPGTTLDRLENNLGYEPGNCAWRTPAEQARNRENTLWIEWRGERRTLKDVSNELGRAYATTFRRYKQGLRGEALLAPPDERKRRS